MPRDPDAPKRLSELAHQISDPAFLDALCHDLRGPLGAIGTWIHVLGSGRADAAIQQQALAAMERDVAAQTRLIEQLSDLSSIVGGTLAVSRVEIDLVSLLPAAGIPVQTEGTESARVVADPGRLHQLLVILLPVQGGRPLSILRADRNGIGLFRIRGSARKQGLVPSTLARALAAAQGGHLDLSPADDGMSFVLELPTPESDR